MATFEQWIERMISGLDQREADILNLKPGERNGASGLCPWHLDALPYHDSTDDRWHCRQCKRLLVGKRRALAEIEKARGWAESMRSWPNGPVPLEAGA